MFRLGRSTLTVILTISAGINSLAKASAIACMLALLSIALVSISSPAHADPDLDVQSISNATNVGTPVLSNYSVTTLPDSSTTATFTVTYTPDTAGT